ncbi:Uncharacterised protein [Vibrio cholerae]|uniref:Uncharacterized protein n=1 Tax=Vibrio cholerae TaxID=666 RepID=A0A655XE93_VIBCL|nr:Uncharacterised protein [Vibrio cholerae]
MHHRGGIAGRTAQLGANTSNQLNHFKGFGEVIVRSCIQTFDPLSEGVACTQNHHRSVDVFVSNAFKDGQTIQFR